LAHRFAECFETRTPPIGGVLSNSAVGTALLSTLPGLLTGLLRLLAGSLPALLAGLLTLLARLVALPALLRLAALPALLLLLAFVILIGHLDLLK